MTSWNQSVQNLFKKEKILELQQILISYLRHPLHEIARLPDLNWPQILTIHFVVTAFSGVLTGLIGRSFLGVFSGVILTPILTGISMSIGTLFFYYLFQLSLKTTLSYRRLFTLVLFANIPFFIFQIISPLIPPVSLIGLALTGLLLCVGLIENFQLPKKIVIRSILAIFAVIFLVWIWGRWESLQFETGWQRQELEAPEVHLGQ